MHRRLASEIARIEAKYPNGLNEDDLLELFHNFTYIIPQGSPMSGIGNNFQISSFLHLTDYPTPLYNKYYISCRSIQTIHQVPLLSVRL